MCHKTLRFPCKAWTKAVHGNPRSGAVFSDPPTHWRRQRKRAVSSPAALWKTRTAADRSRPHPQGRYGFLRFRQSLLPNRVPCTKGNAVLNCPIFRCAARRKSPPDRSVSAHFPPKAARFRRRHRNHPRGRSRSSPSFHRAYRQPKAGSLLTACRMSEYPLPGSSSGAARRSAGCACLLQFQIPLN